MKKVFQLLEQYNQDFLLEYFKKCPSFDFNNLNVNDLEHYLQNLNKLKNEDKEKKEYLISPPELIDVDSIYNCNKPPNGSIFINTYKKENLCNELKEIGIEIIRKNEVSVLFLAGGLGSRLGLNNPKGLLEVTPLMNKTFLQFFFEQIIFLQEYCSLYEKHEHLNKMNEYHTLNKNDNIKKGINNNIHNNIHNNNNYIYNNNNIREHNRSSITNLNDIKASKFKKYNIKLDIHEFKNQDKKKPIIYIYIMTSNFTHDNIVKYLQNNNFFGLKKEQVIFFKQCDNFSTDLNYNLLLSSPEVFLENPGGNGCIFKALDRYNIIDHMIKENIKYIQIVSIDNILNKIADPILIGFCSFFNCDIANKAVQKEDNESMGVFCLKEKVKNKIKKYNQKNKDSIFKNDNTFSVCEYTELNDCILNNKELFKYGNICHHMITLDFLKHIIKNKIYNKLKLHKIIRKKDYIDIKSLIKDNNQHLINSTVFCYEYFIFDIFKYARNILSIEVNRHKEFYPIKNKNNDYGILNAQKALSNLHKSWLQYKNINIIDNKNEEKNFCEISPLVSYDGTFFFDLPQQKDINLPYILERNINS
ncbi:putative UDP-N-acetylglucosamine pyrophosphorylase [Plasmodium gaboni]|uniref:UDP-N-acetylglucosamine diphosphorylase n=1 Tax=Plasmodium gaboni TaxID=647221 RepID=A0A151LEA6_9APIC|nr:putative UDP-N-acetylglucosamine pyrophosphorylase [Plasmodium gaboni]KYN97206.1 putative UDP-N-acetylglucosamine pyrophosphorylase [Plasmodium gaboni]